MRPVDVVEYGTGPGTGEGGPKLLYEVIGEMQLREGEWMYVLDEQEKANDRDVFHRAFEAVLRKDFAVAAKLMGGAVITGGGGGGGEDTNNSSNNNNGNNNGSSNNNTGKKGKGGDEHDVALYVMDRIEKMQRAGSLLPVSFKVTPDGS
eukprot:TRINITY_DN5448_c1_g1_i2.p2 TRINITY_DN5448_c1_g1~~TRINITY_DN5448_c1_g1_i2.p2  ORF type:complete len:149 (+),score=51.46 TRINITY_DN5448_c1_g1_i2:1-447(+)